MDKSKEYIKMCDRKEIQKQWIPKDGDFFCANDDYNNVWVFTNAEYLFDVNKQNNLWLPRQDQLQGIFGDYQACIDFIDRWDCTSSLEHDFPNAISMEQLWLSIMMKEKYNKEWKNNKWQTLI